MELRTLSTDPQARPLTVTLVGRVTCICPVNGRRDFAAVEVVYSPVAAAVELEGFGRYLSEWAGRVASHETVTQEIADDIYAATEADDITVRTRWDAVEGIECVVVAGR